MELYQVGGTPVYLPQLALGIAVTLAITAINYRGIQHSARLQNVTTFGLLAVFALFTTLGLMRGSIGNLPPYFADGRGAAGGLLSILAVLPVVPYFLTGFETVPKCAEERARDFEPRRFVHVMLVALAAGTFFYVMVIVVVTMLQPWPSLVKDQFPTATAFERAFGWKWLAHLILFSGMLSLLKVFNGNFLASTRLLYAMGARDLLGARLGRVHERFQTPGPAIALVGALTVVATCLGRPVLGPITEVGSLACSLGWLATCLAYCCGAGGRRSGREIVVGVLGAIMAIALTVIIIIGLKWYLFAVLAAWAGLGLIFWFRRGAAKTAA
jgi:amino acid transporter